MPDETNSESPAENPAETPVDTGAEAAAPVAVVSSKEPKKHRKWKTALLVLLALLAGAAGGYFWRDNTAKQDQKASDARVATLKGEVADLKKAAAKAAASAETATTDKKAPSATAIENIKASITSGNTAALEGYMAASVHVVIAASEGAFDHTPTQAIADLKYLDSATDPWDFNLPAATLAAWRTGSYASYFPADAVVGRAANKYVVSFTFDNSGKINGVFMAANDDLL